MTIVQMLFGSHLYGTKTPQSDIDYKSVFVPTSTEILLGSVNHTITNLRAKVEGDKNFAGEHEEGAFSLQRYLTLLAEGQTGALDMLFAPAWAFTREPDPLWLHIVKHRDRFLSKKASVFMGYCRQQANKYGIKGSRVAAARSALEILEAGLRAKGNVKLQFLAAEIVAIVVSNEHLEIVAVQQKDGAFIDHFSVCGRKLSFTAPIKLARDVVAGIVDEYGRRALMAESQQGVDWKAMSHAVRVGHEALELLKTGIVTFPLPNAEHVKAIKCGDLPYQEVAAEIEELMECVAAASIRSALPDEPDRDFIKELVLEAHRKQIMNDTGRTS